MLVGVPTFFILFQNVDKSADRSEGDVEMCVYEFCFRVFKEYSIIVVFFFHQPSKLTTSIHNIKMR